MSDDSDELKQQVAELIKRSEVVDLNKVKRNPDCDVEAVGFKCIRDSLNIWQYCFKCLIKQSEFWGRPY